MASTIQRLLVLFALIAAGIAFVAPADASVAPHNAAWESAAVASPPSADKVSANKKKAPCKRKAERSHKSCPVCSKSIALRSANRTRDPIPGLKPRAVPGVFSYEQFAVTAELTSTSLSLAYLAFTRTDFAFGEVFARTGRLRI